MGSLDMSQSQNKTEFQSVSQAETQARIFLLNRLPGLGPPTTDSGQPQRKRKCAMKDFNDDEEYKEFNRDPIQ